MTDDGISMVDEFGMINPPGPPRPPESENPGRPITEFGPQDQGFPPFPWTKFFLALLIVCFLLPWMFGFMSSFSRVFGAYCNWAYRMAGGA